MSAADVAQIIVIAVMLFAVYLFGFGHGHKVGHAQALLDARHLIEELAEALEEMRYACTDKAFRMADSVMAKVRQEVEE